MKLRIKDFQILGDVELEFRKGITAIVGPSNSGKTSILRALGCLINNSSEAKSYIKHGKDKTTVEIELEDKPKIKWIRTPKGANYEIEGEVHDKVGKSNLLDLISLDEFYRDQDSDDLINIQDEWSLLFPFQKTDSQMYKLFEDIFSINDSSVIFRKIKEDESLCKKELCNLNTELLRNKEKSVQLKEYLSSVDINILNKYRDDLSDLDNYISTINKDSDMVKEYLRKYDSLRKLKREEYDLNTLDEYISLDNDCNYIKSNEVFINFNIERTEYDLTLFEDLMSLNTDCDTVLRYLKEYNSLKEDIKKYEEERESISERLRDVKTCPICNQSLREGDSSWI